MKLLLFCTYCLVNLHGVHIGQAGSDLHPVLVDSQQIVLAKVQWKASRKGEGGGVTQAHPGHLSHSFIQNHYRVLHPRVSLTEH